VQTVLYVTATLIAFIMFVYLMFCLFVVLVWLSVPVQVIDQKDSSQK